jgi:hypothetical protein
MKINGEGIQIIGMYKSAMPGRFFTAFTDNDGARIYIDTETLVHLYELVKFDLEHRTGKTMDELFPKEIE